MTLFSRLLHRDPPAGPAWIEPEQLQARLAADTAPLVVDVRGPDEFAGPLGHISGAVNLPLPALAGHVAELLRQDKPLVMVCKTDRRSAAAAAQLQAAGAADVAVLRGGMERWRQLGLA
jgi:rhodanese-related sulfurtransferase